VLTLSHPVFLIFSTVLGAIVGSFLNACIHRLPRGMWPHKPTRSFCPACDRSIPWFENLPVISWILLRGKCSACGARISPRYLVVEVLTAAVFAALWIRFGLPLAPVYWVFLALLITATFIDIEHFIIPDVITYGGTVAGIALCALVPTLMDTDSRLVAAGLSFGGAVLGYGLLWLIVELGKIAFGRKRHAFASPESFSWKRDGETATLSIGEETLAWEDIFSRESDELILECAVVSIDGADNPGTTLRLRFDRLVAGDKETGLDRLSTIEGTLTAVTIPREAMGFGDVKFIACIGAFLGWKAVLFTLCAASVIGCVAALGGIFLARDRAGTRLPFGPFLALGAAIWVFGGSALWDWYFGMFGRGGSF